MDTIFEPRAALLKMEPPDAYSTPAFGEDKCPGPNIQAHNDGTYEFTYESWVKKHHNRDHFDFGRCVFNRKPSEMFVDWKNTGVHGYAAPIAEHGVDSPTDTWDLKPTDLWYGARPARIDAPFRDPKDRKAAVTHPLASYIRMAIPSDAATGPKSLIQIRIFFESRISRAPDNKFRYTYAWRDALATSTRPQVFIDWQSSSVQAAAKASASEMPLTPRVDQQEVSLDSGQPPDYSAVPVLFLDKNRKVVGSTTASIYFPAGTKP